MRSRKYKSLARQIKAYAQRNCLAGVVPDGEIARVHKETLELLEMLGKNLG
jgi:hypothetical protein